MKIHILCLRIRTVHYVKSVLRGCLCHALNARISYRMTIFHRARGVENKGHCLDFYSTKKRWVKYDYRSTMLVNECLKKVFYFSFFFFSTKVVRDITSNRISYNGSFRISILCLNRGWYLFIYLFFAIFL